MGLSKRQLAMRRQGIGASEIAALAGESKYATPIAIYEAKVLGAELEATYQMDLGNELEEPIARIWAKQNERFLARLDTLKHATKPLALATPDRAVYRTIEARGDARRLKTDVRDAEMILQVKSTNWRLAHLWGEEGSDRIPHEFLCQAHWEGSVAGVETVEFAVDFDKTKLKRYRVRVSPAIFEGLYALAERFWYDHVLARVPPPPDATERYTEFLGRVFPTQTSDALVAIPPEDPLARDIEYFARLKAGEKPLKSLLKLIQNRMLARVQDATGITGAFGTLTFKRTRDGSKIDWERVAGEAMTLARTILLAKEISAEQRKELFDAVDGLVARHTSPKPGYRRLHAKWAADLQREVSAIELKLELLQQGLEETAAQSEEVEEQ